MSQKIQDIENYLLASDRTRRENVRPPFRYEDSDFVGYALMIAEDMETKVSKSMAQAKKSHNWKEWDNAAKEEWNSLMKNHIWDLIERPDNARVVGSK